MPVTTPGSPCASAARRRLVQAGRRGRSCRSRGIRSRCSGWSRRRRAARLRTAARSRRWRGSARRSRSATCRWRAGRGRRRADRCRRRRCGTAARLGDAAVLNAVRPPAAAGGAAAAVLAAGVSSIRASSRRAPGAWRRAAAAARDRTLALASASASESCVDAGADRPPSACCVPLRRVEQLLRHDPVRLQRVRALRESGAGLVRPGLRRGDAGRDRVEAGGQLRRAVRELPGAIGELRSRRPGIAAAPVAADAAPVASLSAPSAASPILSPSVPKLSSMFCRVLFEIVEPMVEAAVAAIWFAIRPSAARACGAVVTAIVAFSAAAAGSWIAVPPGDRGGGELLRDAHHGLVGAVLQPLRRVLLVRDDPGEVLGPSCRFRPRGPRTAGVRAGPAVRSRSPACRRSRSRRSSCRAAGWDPAAPRRARRRGSRAAAARRSG